MNNISAQKKKKVQEAREKKRTELKNDIIKRMADNIMESEDIRCAMNKEENPYKLYDMAILCVSKLTNDKTFYTTNKDKLYSRVSL